MNGIIQNNIALMESSERGGMGRLFGSESIGGNASVFEGMPCLGANFCFEPETGKILYFDNPQNVPSDILAKSKQGTFRIALDIRNRTQGIIDIIAYGTTERERAFLMITANEYNKRHHFSRGKYAA